MRQFIRFVRGHAYAYWAFVFIASGALSVVSAPLCALFVVTVNAQVEKSRASVVDKLELATPSGGRAGYLELYHLRPQGVCFLMGMEGMSLQVPCPWDARR